MYEKQTPNLSEGIILPSSELTGLVTKNQNINNTILNFARLYLNKKGNFVLF